MNDTPRTDVSCVTTNTPKRDVTFLPRGLLCSALAVAIVGWLYEGWQIQRDRQATENACGPMPQTREPPALAIATLPLNLKLLACALYHELQAPLRAADGFLKLLEEEVQANLSADGQHFLARSKQALAHAQELALKFMEFARLGTVQIEKRAVNVSALAIVIVDCLRASDPRRHVDVSIESNLVVMADPFLMQQPLQNLIGNAWKFTSKNSHPHIRIGAAPGIENVLEIEDNGCGFDTEQASKLFAPSSDCTLRETTPDTASASRRRVASWSYTAGAFRPPVARETVRLSISP